MRFLFLDELGVNLAEVVSEGVADHADSLLELNEDLGTAVLQTNFEQSLITKNGLLFVALDFFEESDQITRDALV